MVGSGSVPGSRPGSRPGSGSASGSASGSGSGTTPRVITVESEEYRLLNFGQPVPGLMEEALRHVRTCTHTCVMECMCMCIHINSITHVCPP